jgi:hypothetical protein
VPGDAIHELLGCLSGLFRAFLDLLAVLVHSGQEVRLATVQALKPSHHIRQHFFIRMADVRRRVGVVDGGGDVVGFHGGKKGTRLMSRNGAAARRRVKTKNGSRGAPISGRKRFL